MLNKRKQFIYSVLCDKSQLNRFNGLSLLKCLVNDKKWSFSFFLFWLMMQEEDNSQVGKNVVTIDKGIAPSRFHHET